MKALLIAALSFSFSLNGQAKLGVVDKEQVQRRKKFQKLGVNIGKGSRVVLSQQLQKAGAREESLYKVEFVCKHLPAKNEDHCKFKSVNFKNK